jgi:PAS domain S-box-containing protein
MPADATRGTGRDHSPALYAPLGPEAQIAEHERQFREMLEFCPAALVIVDEDGRLLFHNARLRELLGYQKEEIDLIDTRTFWHDLEQRARIIQRYTSEGASC